MASIYDINFTLQSENLLPPDKRKAKTKSFMAGFVVALQLIRDRFFTSYADGFTGNVWDVSLPYSVGDTVRYIDKAVYECIVATAPGDLPTDINYWVKIQDNWIGLRERLRYNSRKLLLEYILNKWFDVAVFPAPQIYITNNTVFGNTFLLGQTGPTSSTMADNSLSQQYFLSLAPTFNTNCFTIFVPVLVFNALDPSPTNAENIIRAIADKYVIAGMLYDVQTF